MHPASAVPAGASGSVWPFWSGVLAAGTLRAQGTELTIGDWYRVGVQRRGVARSYEGTLIKVTDKWLVLNAVTHQTANQGVPVLARLAGGRQGSR